MSQNQPRSFLTEPVQAESELFIKSICQLCGAFKIVSCDDGSQEKWETTHQCDQVVRTFL